MTDADPAAGNAMMGSQVHAGEKIRLQVPPSEDVRWLGWSPRGDSAPIKDTHLS